MKTISFPLLSAGVLAWSFVGCAAASGGRPEAGQALEPRSPLAIALPLAEGDDSSSAQTDRSIASLVDGLDESEVLQTLGRPAQRLTPEIWIYWRYYSPEKAAEMSGHDTLVVAFARGKVSGMKLVNSEVLQKHLAARRYRTARNQL